MYKRQGQCRQDGGTGAAAGEGRPRDAADVGQHGVDHQQHPTRDVYKRQVLGGAIVDGGKFDWMAHAEKFPGLCTPDES